MGWRGGFAVQITMGGWLMNIAWLIFIVFAYFGFEDPLKKQKKTCAHIPPAMTPSEHHRH